MEPYTIVTGPQDWVAADYRGPENAHKWQYTLTEGDIAEIEAALKVLEASGKAFQVGEFAGCLLCSVAAVLFSCPFACNCT